MDKPKFSIVTCGKNEAKTLPRLLKSLGEFFARGGEMIFVDTGSTDGTADVARAQVGVRVFEEGDRFRHVITDEDAAAINAKFVWGGDPEIIHGGDAFFAFDQARNYAMSLASCDFLATPDCDEAWTTLHIDRINELIAAGYEKMLVDFVFAHHPDGTPAVAFCADTRFYDRRRIQWKGIIHETMQHAGELKMTRLTKDVAYLEHYQNKETDRTKYLSGLAWACYLEPENDRNSHYFARELMYRGFYQSAIREFERHIAMNAWADERGQSMVFLGACYDALGHADNALGWWHKAFDLTGTRREPLISLAYYWKHKNKPALVAAYAAAALQIPNNGFYANRVSNYTYEPHALMYWAKGWQGDIPAARQHLLKCLEYHPTDKTFLGDMKYYFTEAEQKEARDKAGVTARPGAWVPGRVINRIALPITRACNRNCPECSARMADPNWDRAHPHVSVEELREVGKTLGPIGKVEVTGGEPSLHPDFVEISAHIHDWFDSKDIMLLTNGYLFEDRSKLPLLLNYDRVYVSHYTQKFADKYGTAVNTAVCDLIQDYLAGTSVKFWRQTMDAHVPIGHPPYGGTCMFGYDKGDSVGYGAGRIYGCCTAYWLSDRGKSIPLTADWRDRLGEIECPCDKCFLSGEKTA